MAIAAALAGCATPPAQPAKPRPAHGPRARLAPAPLYPTTPGLRWDYVLNQRDVNKPRRMAMGIASAVERDGEVEAVLERRWEAWSPPATRVRASAERVVLSRLADPPDGPSLTILRLPATPGQRWAGRPLAAGNQESVVVRGEERIEVPAGVFTAVRVDHELGYANGDSDVLSYWYAPGVGCVRMIERTTLYVGDKPLKLEVEGLLTALVPGGWPLPGLADAIARRDQAHDVGWAGLLQQP